MFFKKPTLLEEQCNENKTLLFEKYFKCKKIKRR